MKSPKVNTQKTLSAIIALSLAFVTLFQAAAANTSNTAVNFVSAEEAALVAEFDQYFEDAAMEEELEETIIAEVMDTTTESVKIFDTKNNLIAEGNPDTDYALSMLVNQGDYLSQMGAHKYYRVAQ